MKLTFEQFVAGEVDPNLVVVFPGRFNPAHKNHAKVYNFLKKTFPYAYVLVSTTDVVKLPKSPFTFEEKKIMLSAAGIPESAIIKSKSPYSTEEISNTFNSSTHRLFFAVGGKDMTANDPRFATPSPARKIQLLPQSAIDITKKDINSLPTFDKHAYIATIPTFRFNINIAGRKESIEGATAIREMYSRASESGKKDIIKQLYGTFREDIYDIFNKRLP